MSKPDWKDAPSWAMWLAADPNGYWVWFENEPEFDGTGWMQCPSDSEWLQTQHPTSSAHGLERRP